jgi:hypothetical protein
MANLRAALAINGAAATQRLCAAHNQLLMGCSGVPSLDGSTDGQTIQDCLSRVANPSASVLLQAISTACRIMLPNPELLLTLYRILKLYMLL